MAIRASQAIVPKRIARAIRTESERLRRLQESREAGRETDRISGMVVDALEQAPDDEYAIVTGSIDSYEAAKEDQSSAPDAYQPGAGWRNIVESEWAEIRAAIQRRDITAVAGFLRNFFRNEGASGFWGGARTFERFVSSSEDRRLGRAAQMQRQIDAWRAALPTCPISALDVPRIGNPWGFVVDGALLYEPICEYHHQAYYFETLLHDLAAPTIVEIGGGFGGLACQILRRFSRATYVAVDLPEALLIQSYYLRCAFPELAMLTYKREMPALSGELLEKFDVVLLPNFMLPEIAAGFADLVVNVRSLSEMPAATIDEYLRQVDRIGRLFFFHENLCQERPRGRFGIPSTAYPPLVNHILVVESESVWPKYQAGSSYPCHQHLFLHRSVLERGDATDGKRTGSRCGMVHAKREEDAASEGSGSKARAIDAVSF